mgnify:CR=1 FL=1
MRNRELRRERGGDRKGVFGAEQWTTFGTDATSGANELIRGRPCVSLRFSSLQPNLVLSVHPSTDDDDDLRPLKGLYGIWDVTSPDAPSFVLEGAGVPTSACFSGSQTYLVLGGTAEGALHLWDLREPNHLHRDR